MNNTVLMIIVIALLLVGGYFLWQAGVFGDLGMNAQTPTTTPQGSGGNETNKRYASTQHGLSFEYPTRYFLTERDVSTPQRTRHVIVLVDDTQENRDVLSGTSSTPREGPIAITVDIFTLVQNENDDIETWVRCTNDSNFKLGNMQLASTTVDGEEAVRYHWSGLYEGDTVAVSRSGKIYLFSTTYIDPTDFTRGDFDDFIESVEFTN